MQLRNRHFQSGSPAFRELQGLVTTALGSAALGPVRRARLLSLSQTKNGTYSYHSSYTNDNRPGSQGSEHHKGNGHT